MKEKGYGCVDAEILYMWLQTFGQTVGLNIPPLGIDAIK
jgi:hypothetical protein